METEKIGRIRKILDKDPFHIGKVYSESRIKEFEKWDSMKHLMFLIAVEKEFDKDITPEQANSIHTIDDLLRLLK